MNPQSICSFSAPHPDDEVIGCTGVMLKAIERGKRIGIVVITNGDGFPRGTAAITGKSREELTPEDYLSLADLRQGQSVQGLAHLGLKEEHLTFLAYPDGLLAKIYRSENSSKFHQTYTDKNGTYPLTFTDYHSLKHGKPAPYTKSAILSDIEEIIRTRKPREIYVTNQLDSHGDHKASFWYVRDAALAAGFSGQLYTYIVHGKKLQVAPFRRIALSDKEVAIKKAAIREHKIPTVHDTLDRHATEFELFWPTTLSQEAN